MSDICGNPSCSVFRHQNNGKYVCAEIEISSATELHQRKVAYIWLCNGCARLMKPESEVVEAIIPGLLTMSSESFTLIPIEPSRSTAPPKPN